MISAYFLDWNQGSFVFCNSLPKVDKKYLVGPLVEDVERIMSGVYGRRDDGRPKMHPNKKDHRIICELLYNKLNKLYLWKN